jgi:hypothetical protein
VWLRSNKTFVPALGTAYFDLRLARCGLSSLNRGWVGFHKQTIFEPGQPQRAMPAAFFFLDLDARLNGRTRRGLPAPLTSRGPLGDAFERHSRGIKTGTNVGYVTSSGLPGAYRRRHPRKYRLQRWPVSFGGWLGAGSWREACAVATERARHLRWPRTT